VPSNNAKMPNDSIEWTGHMSLSLFSNYFTHFEGVSPFYYL
jgi:hypothetical protein